MTLFGGGNVVDIGCGNEILTCFLALQHLESVVMGVDLSSNAILVAKELAGKLGVNNVQFTDSKSWRKEQCNTLFSCRTVHENVAWRALREERKSGSLSLAEQIEQYRAYAKELAALVKGKGYLVSVEHYGDDSAHAALIRALECEGFSQVKGTYMQFSCKNGDGVATFQAMIFQKTGV